MRPLLKGIDDRYVIMNSGDEMALRFKASASPAPGWKRDFVFTSDGWTKDGNLNTAYSKAVLPLPSHARPAYSSPPTRLQDDPVYQAHRDDWRNFHTRYITPHRFRNTLLPQSKIASR